jgi:GGDEF domain-containing protein
LHEVAADGAAGEEALGRARKSIQRELSFLATHDGLTKLAVRLALESD